MVNIVVPFVNLRRFLACGGLWPACLPAPTACGAAPPRSCGEHLGPDLLDAGPPQGRRPTGPADRNSGGRVTDGQVSGGIRPAK